MYTRNLMLSKLCISDDYKLILVFNDASHSAI